MIGVESLLNVGERRRHSHCPSPYDWQRNPFAPVVPCHRVVMGDLSIGGFRCGWIVMKPS